MPHFFLSPDHFAFVVCAGLVLLTAYRPSWGFLALLTGFAFADRDFALIHCALLGIPVFITELVLGTSLLRIACSEGPHWLEAAKHPNWRSPWLWFTLLGAWSAFRGLFLFHPVLVARDAALTYYAVFAFITYRLFKKPEDVRVIFWVVVGGLLARFVYGRTLEGTAAVAMYCSILVLGAFCAYSQWARWRAPLYIICSILIMALATTSIRTAWVSFLVAFLFMAVLLKRMNSALGPAWKLGLLTIVSSLLLCEIYTIWSPYRILIFKQRFESFAQGTYSANVMTRLAMWEDSVQAVIPSTGRYFSVFDRRVLNPWLGVTQSLPPKYVPPKPLTAGRNSVSSILTRFEKPAGPIETGSNKEASNAYAEANQYTWLSQAAVVLSAPPKPSSAPTTPHPTASPVAGHRIKLHRAALLVVQDADNKSAMASQAALDAIKLSKEASQMSRVLLHLGPENERLAQSLKEAGETAIQAAQDASEKTRQAVVQADELRHMLAIHGKTPEEYDRIVQRTKSLSGSASDISAASARAYKECENVSRLLSYGYDAGARLSGPAYWAAMFNGNKTIRLLFGIPYGKVFIPGRISFVHSIDRYDPHNSFVAVLYRTGILGLAVFLAILWTEFRKSYEVAARAASLVQKELLLACMTGVIFHLMNSLGDVTFENPFKGGILWILLGLMVALRSMNPPQSAEKS